MQGRGEQGTESSDGEVRGDRRLVSFREIVSELLVRSLNVRGGQCPLLLRSYQAL